jgi:hypothetical protein
MLVILHYTLPHNVHCICSLLGRITQRPGALWAYLGMYRDSFTLTFTRFPSKKNSYFDA